MDVALGLYMEVGVAGSDEDKYKTERVLEVEFRCGRPLLKTGGSAVSTAAWRLAESSMDGLWTWTDGL